MIFERLYLRDQPGVDTIEELVEGIKTAFRLAPRVLGQDYAEVYDQIDISISTDRTHVIISAKGSAN